MESKTTFNLKQEAQRVFSSILLDEPSNISALYGKALILYKDGEIQESLKQMEEVIKIDPMDEISIKAKELSEKINKLYQASKVFKNPDGLKPKLQIQTIQIAGHKIGQRVSFDQKDKTRTCTICDKNFTKQFSLNRHMFLHSGEKPHKCSICRKAFIQKTDLDRHETTHSVVFNFECNLCDKKFKTKKNLNCHKVTHSVARPYKCGFCEKDFKVKRLMIFHEGLHSKVKPFNCDICGKGFPAKPYIKSHLKTHFDEKPFVCPFCNFAFKRNYDLNFHIRNQHKNV